MKNIFFTGTAGSGKSQLTSILSNWYQQEGKDVITVNLDPGVNNLPYGVDVDIRDYINLKHDKKNITLAALEDVTDPRNIGSIIRSAASFIINFSFRLNCDKIRTN